MCGSKTVMGGELVLNCCVGVKNVDGLAIGAGSSMGKPPATVLFKDVKTAAESAHPFVIEAKEDDVVEYDVVQLCTSPGVLPAAAVTWNDEIVSKARP